MQSPALERKIAGPASSNAPSVTLPLRFLVTGICSLIVGMVLLILRPDVLATYHYNQYVIAITHLFVLGWIATVVMGSVYQLVPVALETRLYSERLASIQFVLHVTGFVGMVFMFWSWNLKQVGHFGSVLAVGAVLFIYNVFRTLLRVPRWNVVASAVASTLVWLGITILLGLMVAAGKCSYETEVSGQGTGLFAGMLRALAAVPGFMAHFDPIATMHAHAHAGIAGAFLILIVGVSYRLVPMFTLSELQSPRRATASIILLNAGLLVTFVSILLRSSYKPLSAGVIAIGLAVYAIEMRAILRARKRRAVDWGLRYFLTAVSLLGVLGLLGLVLSWPNLALTTLVGQLENAYGLLAILGLVSLAIVGMLYKIVPFIVWYTCYSKQIGLNKVPSLAELYSPRIQKLGYWFFLAGLAVTAGATVVGHPLGVRAGCCLFSAGVGSLVLNVLYMLRHYLRPRLGGPLGKPGASHQVPALAGTPAHPGSIHI